MNSSHQKLVIVTGANKGIGLQIVKDVLKLDASYSVILTSRDVKRGQDAMKQVESQQDTKGRLFYEQLDIESEKSIESFIETVQKKYKSIYALVNNAAVFYEEIYKMEDFFNSKITETQTRTMLNVNVRGTISVSEKIIPYLQEKGRIIFISTMVAQKKYQGEEPIKLHFDSELTDKGFHELLNKFEEKAVKHEHTTIGYANSIYFNTKFFLNTYVREIVKNHLKKGQTAFTVHPGTIYTDMGKSIAEAVPLDPVEEGTVSTIRVLKFSEEEAEENNLKFFDEKGNLFDF